MFNPCHVKWPAMEERPSYPARSFILDTFLFEVKFVVDRYRVSNRQILDFIQ